MIEPVRLTKQIDYKIQIYINPSATEEYHYTCKHNQFPFPCLVSACEKQITAKHIISRKIVLCQQQSR